MEFKLYEMFMRIQKIKIYDNLRLKKLSAKSYKKL